MNITEVSKKYDITPDTLRYYERVGLIPPVTRNKNLDTGIIQNMIVSGFTLLKLCVMQEFL